MFEIPKREATEHPGLYLVRVILTFAQDMKSHYVEASKSKYLATFELMKSMYDTVSKEYVYTQLLQFFKDKVINVVKDEHSAELYLRTCFIEDQSIPLEKIQDEHLKRFSKLILVLANHTRTKIELKEL